MRRDKSYMPCNRSPEQLRTLCLLMAATLILPALAYGHHENGLEEGAHRGETIFAPTYGLRDLGLLAGYARATSTDLNNRGDATGLAIPDGDGSDHGVLFRRGRVIDVAPGATASYASAINSRDQVTGYFYNGQKWNGFLYEHGRFQGFTAPNAQATYPDSINDLGQVAGTFTATDSSGHIFVREANGSFRDLGAFGADPSALAINNQGRVLIGTYDAPRGHTYLSRPGSVSLEEIPSLIPNGSVTPGDMNEWGLVVGAASSDAITGNQHAYLYFEGKIKDLGVLPGGDSTVGYGINNLGQTVGQAYQAAKITRDASGQLISYTSAITHGWVSAGGKLRDVNGLLNGASKGWEISVARKINDRGEVLADANFNNGEVHEVLLMPSAILPALGSVIP
jgi:probable HAF family extracellular repeat protein